MNDVDVPQGLEQVELNTMDPAKLRSFKKQAEKEKQLRKLNFKKMYQKKIEKIEKEKEKIKLWNGYMNKSGNGRRNRPRMETIKDVWIEWHNLT